VSGDEEHTLPETLPGCPNPDQLDARFALARLRERMFHASTPVYIERYRLLGLLGRGAHGRVFEAEDSELHRKIALKLMRAEGPGPGMPRSLLREAQSLAQLSHPNVVAVYDVGLHDEQVWIAMELVRGCTLAQWARRHPPGSAGSVERARVILDQAAAGLAAAHERGLVHRDFKPANVLVGDDGRVRVADFGLARAYSTRADPIESEPDTSMTAIAGTPRYMSPEQLRGDRVDAASDQFGFAVTAWELLLGVHPFAGLSPPELAHAAELRPVAGPGSAVVPSFHVRALRRALQADPADRFASMDQLRQALSPRARSRAWWGAAGIGAILALATTTLVLERSRAMGPTRSAPPSRAPEPDAPAAPPSPREAALGTKLAQARADLAAARYARAAAESEGIAQEAARARLGQLAADAHEVAGIAWGELIDPRRFEAFEAAYYLTAELTDGRDLARHANSLAMQHAYHGALDEAEAWARHAEAGLRRHPDEVQRLARDHVRGLVQLKRDELPAAIATFEHVLERLGDRGEEAERLRWLAGMALLQTYAASDRHADVSALARRLRQQTEQTLGPAHPRLARISMILGSSARKRGEFGEAIAHMEEAVELSEHGYGPRTSRTAMAYLNLGYTHLCAGDRDAAEQSYRRGLVAIGDTHDAFRVRLLRGLATVCSARGDHRCAEARLQAAASSARRIWPDGGPEFDDTLRGLAEELLRGGSAVEAAHHLRDVLEASGPSPAPDELARAVVDLAEAAAQGAEVPDLPVQLERAASACGASGSPWCQRVRVQRDAAEPPAASGAHGRQ